MCKSQDSHDWLNIEILQHHFHTVFMYMFSQVLKGFHETKSLVHQVASFVKYLYNLPKRLLH